MDCEVKDDGKVYIRFSNGELSPVIVEFHNEKKELIVPYQRALRNWDDKSMIAFHPGCEAVFKGQSEIITLLTNLASIKLYNATMQLATVLLFIAKDKTTHDKLNRLSIKKIISELSNVDNTTIQYFQKINEKTTATYGAYPFMSLKMYYAPENGGVKFNRGCKLLTPILNEKDPIYGIKTSNNAQRMIRMLLEKLFPEVKFFGSNSQNTPYFDSLIGMYVETANYLNMMKDSLGKHGEKLKTIDVTWYEESKELGKLKNEFLNINYPGNTGSGVDRNANSDTITMKPITMPNVVSKPDPAGNIIQRQPVIIGQNPSLTQQVPASNANPPRLLTTEERMRAAKSSPQFPVMQVVPNMPMQYMQPQMPMQMQMQPQMQPQMSMPYMQQPMPMQQPMQMQMPMQMNPNMQMQPQMPMQMQQVDQFGRPIMMNPQMQMQQQMQMQRAPMNRSQLIPH